MYNIHIYIIYNILLYTKVATDEPPHESLMMIPFPEPGTWYLGLQARCVVSTIQYIQYIQYSTVHTVQYNMCCVVSTIIIE